MSITKYLSNKVTTKVTLTTVKKYSIWFYTGGVDVKNWNKLDISEKENALQKDWCLSWCYRHDGKLVRQTNIKAGVNRYKTKSERLIMLKALKLHLEELLDAGFDPFDKHSDILTPQKSTDTDILCCIEKALSIWSKTVNSTTYDSYKSRIKQFEKWLISKGFRHRNIDTITRRILINYLNEILDKSSPKNRNNVRAVLYAFFELLISNEIIDENPCTRIPLLKAKPTRNKTYTQKQFTEIFDYLKTENPQLLLFIKIVSYNFLRPIEVCRLTIRDLNFNDKTLTVRAKNSPLKTKIIPEILLSEIAHLKGYSPDFFIVTPSGEPGLWATSEKNRRDYMTKQFLKAKQHFNLDKNYTIYSFRHTLITSLYRELRKKHTPFETKSRLMLITGHTTMTALEKYLRDIDAELPEDYSDLILSSQGN